MENLEDFQFIIGKKSSSEDSGDRNPFLDATRSIDCYLSQLSISGSSPSRPLFDFLEYVEKKKKVINVRIVTNINAENIDLAKRLARHFDVYHLENIEGNFCIIDAAIYFCDIENPSSETRQSYTQLMSKQASFVRLQQNLFENLLNQSKLARDRIKEVEYRVQSEYVETLRDLATITRVIRERTETAAFDTQVLFATINSFYWAENDGIIDMLGRASSRGLNVRILIKIDDDTMKEVSKYKIKERYDRININFIHQPLKSKITTFIFDQSYSLTLDLNQNSEDNFSQGDCLGTYSNTESRVLTDLSMFESLWIQAERERHQTIRQAYFEMFSGRRLKDETYERNWTSNEI